MKKERPNIFPHSEYKFDERLKEVQILIKKCFREAIKIGFPENLTGFSITNAIEERRSFQIKFSPVAMKLFSQIAKRQEIRNMIARKKEIDGLDTKIMIITKKEVFIISEGGLQVFRRIFETACKIIKQQLTTKLEKERKYIEDSKGSIRKKVSDILPDNNDSLLVSVSHKNKNGKKEFYATFKSDKEKWMIHNKSANRLINYIELNKDFIKGLA